MSNIEIKFRVYWEQTKEMDYNPYLVYENKQLNPVSYVLRPQHIFHIMPYIEIIDNAGKEIYVGDILNEENSKLRIVDDVTQSWYHGQSLKVMGNIYENSELIEKLGGRNWRNFIPFIREHLDHMIQ